VGRPGAASVPEKRPRRPDRSGFALDGTFGGAVAAARLAVRRRRDLGSVILWLAADKAKG
jgi:hypothetical protein